MKVLHIGISGAALVLLASCTTLGADGKDIDYGAGSTQVPTLDVPPDLTAPGSDESYLVPQGDGGAATTYSDYSKGGIARDVGVGKVLPDIQGVRLERDGALRWLVVSDRAENVWEVVKAFWQATGLTVGSENQAAGVMETDWVENRARFPQGGPHKGLRQELNSAYAASERDQYVTRLERSKDGASTEVHITHRGIRKGSAAASPQWEARANAAELEAIMLQLLMVRFGASEAQAASAVTGTVAASGVAAIGAIEPAGTASLREVSGDSVVIAMNDPFDRAWRKVGLSLESSGLAVEDKDREKGFYFLGPVKIERGWWDRMKFWKASADAKKHYRVFVKDGGKACEVSVTDQDGASSNVTRELTEAIYKNINQ